MVRNLGSSPGEFKTGSHTQTTAGRDWKRRQATPAWKEASLISKGFTQEACLRQLHHRLVSARAHQNLEFIYDGTLTEFSHLYCPDDLNNLLPSQGCVLKMAGTTGMIGRTYKDREGTRSL